MMWRARTIWLPQMAEFARLLVGVPSYRRYVDHLRLHHPDVDPMSREVFFKERQEARYGSQSRTGRCC
jgi:uncharacterized short protein YbdD (DUF466 family)